jgi:hypothetical protein
MGRGLLVCAVALLALVSGCSSDGDTPYSEHLVKYGDRGEPNVYVNLDDGQAQLAIGSPDGHRIVVQWRDPDGSGWTAPDTVWTDKKNLAIENTVRYGGGTVAIRQTYTSDVHDDQDDSAIDVGIVCRDLSCTATADSGGGGEAQVTPDGQTVLLGQTEKAVSLWSEDEGIRLARWSGHPGFEYQRVSPSEPLLAPDGSLRVVSALRARGACTFELLASAPDSARLERVATSTQQLRGGHPSDCRSYLGTYSADWVTVHPEDHRAPDFWFVRDGDSWTTTSRDPSGLRLIDDDRACCSSATAGFVHWNDVTFGSRDGHRIEVQSHLLGDETWRKPTVLAGAPPGYPCTWMDGYEVGDHGFAVVMVCHSGKAKNEFVGDSYAVAASADLQHWTSTFVTDVRTPPEVDDDGALVVGGTTWTENRGFSS